MPVQQEGNQLRIRHCRRTVTYAAKFSRPTHGCALFRLDAKIFGS